MQAKRFICAREVIQSLHQHAPVTYLLAQGECLTENVQGFLVLAELKKEITRGVQCHRLSTQVANTFEEADQFPELGDCWFTALLSAVNVCNSLEGIGFEPPVSNSTTQLQTTLVGCEGVIELPAEKLRRGDTVEGA